MRALRDIGRIVVLTVFIAPFTAFGQDGNSNDATASSTAASSPSAKAVKAANRKLAKSVRLAMAKAKGIDMTNLFVYAKGGRVTLTGSVPVASQVERAGEAAKNVTGVSSVDNRLSVYAIDR